MRNEGHSAEMIRRLLWLITLALLKGLFLATDTYKDLLIFHYLVGSIPPEAHFLKYKFFALELLLGFATFLALFKILFVSTANTRKDRYSHLPWWRGR